MEWLNNLIRPDLRGFTAYQSARVQAGGAVADVAVDANESPWPPFGSIAAQCEANRYPEPQPVALRARLASVYGVEPERLLLGRGSDELIDVLIRLFCRAGADNIIICPPTFGMYEAYAAVQGAAVVRIPLTSEYQLDVKGILAACNDKTKLIFITSPNAPMGNKTNKQDMLELCKARAGKSIIVVDEAYVEFSEESEGILSELKNNPNMVVLRTMSKAHGLAGERVGCAIAAPEIIKRLQGIQSPYPLTQSSIVAAMDALSPNGLIQSRERRRIIVEERERMAKLLLNSPMVKKILPSATNFLFIVTTDSKAFMQKLASFGIRIRNRDNDVPNAVRITIGTPEENDLVLQSLDIKIPANAKANQERLFSAQRITKETSIAATVNLDNPGFMNIKTGIGFFDHMISQVAQHGGFGLELNCKGDLAVDQHHTIEDCALALGEALKAALGDKKGIARFGFSAPLDEALAEVVVDLSGRPYADFTGKIEAKSVGELDTEMVPHFFRSLATALGASIHVTVKGYNAHHITEASFKALGRALRQAFKRDGEGIPSTKGAL